jgi:hypothetical protein
MIRGNVGPIFGNMHRLVSGRKSREKKPRGYSDHRSYQRRLQDALNVFETREITDRIRLQNVWCSFIKQPKKSDVPIIEAYAIISLHNPQFFKAKVWTYKGELIRDIDAEHISLTQAEISQRMDQINDFITQAKYDITPVVVYAIKTFPTL